MSRLSPVPPQSEAAVELIEIEEHEPDQQVNFSPDSGWRGQEKRRRFYAFYCAQLHERS